MTPTRDIPVAEWLAEGLRRFGGGKENWKAWRFQCPVCKHVATPAEFQALGAEPQLAYQECIGRQLPKDQCASDLAETPTADGKKSPCNYAAYGLFRFGLTVLNDAGKPVPVLPFADALPGLESQGATLAPEPEAQTVQSKGSE